MSHQRCNADIWQVSDEALEECCCLLGLVNCRDAKPLHVDLGCGDGSYVLQAARADASRCWLGLDYNEAPLRKAAEAPEALVRPAGGCLLVPAALQCGAEARPRFAGGAPASWRGIRIVAPRLRGGCSSEAGAHWTESCLSTRGLGDDAPCNFGS